MSLGLRTLGTVDKVSRFNIGESNNFKNEDTDLEKELIKKETTRVNLSKLIVYGIILVAAVVVGICTYFYMEKEEAIWIQDEVS